LKYALQGVCLIAMYLSAFRFRAP